jgi:hypothetical protein
VDFCRGSGGAFLAVNGMVVAGEANGDGTARVIQGFQISGQALLRAVSDKPIEAAKECRRCQVYYPEPAPAECDHCGGVLG